MNWKMGMANAYVIILLYMVYLTPYVCAKGFSHSIYLSLSLAFSSIEVSYTPPPISSLTLITVMTSQGMQQMLGQSFS